MEAKELRIGNWLNGNYNGFSKEIKIYNFTRHKIQHTDEKQIPTSIGNFKPIPLTEDWLLRFRFEVDGMSKWGGWLSPRFDLGSQIRIRDYSDYFKMQIAKIKYVHQLQNLYFALTGHELEIKST